MKWMLGYTSALCCLVLIVCTSIAFPTFFMPFYSHEYEKYQVPETIRVAKDELMDVTQHLTDYMRGKKKDLVVFATVDGGYREFFNQREKDHMVDVQYLFTIGFRIRNAAAWLLLLMILALIFLKIPVWPLLARCCREVIAGFLMLAVLLGFVIALDFQRAFEIFHLLFFTNDLWQLNPATDLLVNIVPLGFFNDIAVFISAMIVVLSSAVMIAATIYLRFTSESMFKTRRT